MTVSSPISRSKWRKFSQSGDCIIP
ncbi:hypothetical protein AB9E14_17070 [Rhizobium leguminosarum]